MNYYLGNYIAGTSLVDWTNVLSCFRQALGSNDRANLNAASINDVRVDWRPNLVDENLTGAISAPTTSIISNNGNLGVGVDTLTTNSRLALAYTTTNRIAMFANGVSNQFILAHTPITLLSTDNFWMVANNRSISYFIYRNSNAYYFFTQGFLLNSPLSFPENAYAFYISRNGVAFDPVIGGNNQSSECHSRGFAGSLLKTLHTSTTNANYSHTRLSDGSATTAEVELYLRDATTNIPYGYIPNVFKWKVDGSEVAPAIGDTVRLNLANATGYYAGQGNIFCTVVGRLGATRNSFDQNGDYILMRVAG